MKGRRETLGMVWSDMGGDLPPREVRPRARHYWSGAKEPTHCQFAVEPGSATSHPLDSTAVVSVFAGTPPTKPLAFQIYKGLKRVLLSLVFGSEHGEFRPALPACPSNCVLVHCERTFPRGRTNRNREVVWRAKARVRRSILGRIGPMAAVPTKEGDLELGDAGLRCVSKIGEIRKEHAPAVPNLDLLGRTRIAGRQRFLDFRKPAFKPALIRPQQVMPTRDALGFLPPKELFDSGILHKPVGLCE